MALTVTGASSSSAQGIGDRIADELLVPRVVSERLECRLGYLCLEQLYGAGARYFSDEYAVFDEAGRVHPYPKPLSQRREGRGPLLHPPESLGDPTDLAPVPLARIVVTRFREGAAWKPEPITPADAMMALFDNTLVARSRPDFALSRLAKAVEGAEGLQGERGESSGVVAALLNA